MKYHVAYTIDVVVHVEVDADSPNEARRLAGPEQYRHAVVLTPRLKAAVADIDEAEIDEEWHLARVDALMRATAVEKPPAP